MLWFLIIPGIIIILTIKYQGFRYALLAVIALVAILVFWYYEYERREEIASKQRISVEQIDLIDLRLGGTTELFGRIRNKSPVYTLTRVALELTMHDCVKEDCEIVGQTTENIYVTIPPGQARDFKRDSSTSVLS